MSGFAVSVRIGWALPARNTEIVPAGASWLVVGPAPEAAGCWTVSSSLRDAQARPIVAVAMPMRRRLLRDNINDSRCHGACGANHGEHGETEARRAVRTHSTRPRRP